MKKVLLVCLLLSFNVLAKEEAKSALESKLNSLNIPSDKVTPVVSEEKLYAVNQRYSSLKNRHEFTLLGANNFNADSHLDTRVGGATYRYHISGKWSLGVRYQEYENVLSSAGTKLFDSGFILPDTDYATKSSGGFVNYNTFYGKLRFSEDTIVYFDNYVALGYGKIALASGEVQYYNADLGFSFWFGKHLSTRVGVNNEFYTQNRINGKSNVHHAMGYIEIGYLFGEGSRL